MMIQVRQATKSDAHAAINTLRCSITKLCEADHNGDPEEIRDWLANKTEEAWQQWLAREDSVMLVAERDGKIVGVGMAALNGNILLNYVHPEARFSGISKAILAEMEHILKSKNIVHCHLESTVTARQFYESCGFQSKTADPLSLSKAL